MVLVYAPVVQLELADHVERLRHELDAGLDTLLAGYVLSSSAFCFALRLGFALGPRLRRRCGRRWRGRRRAGHPSSPSSLSCRGGFLTVGPGLVHHLDTRRGSVNI